MADPLQLLVGAVADAVAARLSQAPRPDDPTWGKVSQDTLPPWIHPKAYIEACRAGRITGARRWRRQWIAERAAVEAWWIAESRDPAANDGPGEEEDPESDQAVLAANGLAVPSRARARAR